MSEYYCTNCGADLGEQKGFSPNKSHWTCTECGQFLTDPEIDDSSSRYPEAGWFCDKCGAYLNNQSGFSDWYDEWTCKKCGHTNSISEDEIFSSEEEYQKHKRDECIEEDEYEEESYYDDDDEYEEEYYDEYEEDLEEEYDDEESDESENDEHDDNELPQITISKRLWWFISRKKLPVGVSSSECTMLKAKELDRILGTVGFYNISLVPAEVLDLEDIEKENYVKSVRINGEDRFGSEDKFLHNSNIEIVYFKLRKVKMPISSKQAKGMQATEVENMLLDSGFKNIKMIAVHDVVIGWIKKEGEIGSTTVNGKKLVLDKEYRLDAAINIEYHTSHRKK